MKVAIYDYVSGQELYRDTDELAVVIPDLIQRAHAQFYLTCAGRYWVGGGASPLILLTRVADADQTCER